MVFRAVRLRDKGQECPKGRDLRSPQSAVLFRVRFDNHKGRVLFCDETQGVGSRWIVNGVGERSGAAGEPDGSAQ